MCGSWRDDSACKEDPLKDWGHLQGARPICDHEGQLPQQAYWMYSYSSNLQNRVEVQWGKTKPHGSEEQGPCGQCHAGRPWQGSSNKDIPRHGRHNWEWRDQLQGDSHERRPPGIITRAGKSVGADMGHWKRWDFHGCEANSVRRRRVRTLKMMQTLAAQKPTFQIK